MRKTRKESAKEGDNDRREAGQGLETWMHLEPLGVFPYTSLDPLRL